MKVPDNNKSSIRTAHTLSILFVIALSISTYFHYDTESQLISPDFWWSNFLRIMGSAFALVAIPAIVIVPWRLVQRKSGITNTPIYVGILLFIVLTSLLFTTSVFEILVK